MPNLFLYLFVFAITIWGLPAQSIKFEHYNDKNGLSHNSVRHIVQDKDGFLWLGTFSGFNRFDGYEFRSFTSGTPVSNTIPNDDITALELDGESNNLWIGTRGGLSLYKMDTHRFRTFLPEKDNPNSLQDKEVRAIHVDRFKQVWVGTKDNGLFRYYPEQGVFKKIELPGFDYIKAVFEDSKGLIWIGSFKTAGVAKISLDNLGNIASINTYTLEIPDSAETNPYINFIYEDHKSAIFVGSREGLYKLNERTDTFQNLYITDPKIRDKLGPYFNCIARAPDGKYWLGTLGGILVVENLEDIPEQKYQWHYSELSDDDSLIDNLVSALYFDASGVLWIGTEDGLDKYDPFENQFKYNSDISPHIGNQVPRIRGFSKTYDNKIIVATRHNGLFIFKEEVSSPSIGDVSPLYNNHKDIASIFSIDGKIFYCGLWNGKVLVYDYLSNSSKVVDIGFKRSPVLAFMDLGNDRMLIGSSGEGAIVVSQNSSLPEKPIGTLLPNTNVNRMVSDGKGKIWFATQTGAVCYDTLTQGNKIYNVKGKGQTGLSHNNVSDIAIDSTGKIWVGTRKGLDYYDTSIDDFVRGPKELNGRWITDVVVDDKGNLWLNMNNNSVARYKISSKELKVYHTNSGNRLDVFSLSGFYYADGSHVYLGGKNGIISFPPHGLKDNYRSPPPVITKIRVQNKDIDVGGILNGQEILKKDLNISRELILENDNKNFSLTFSSPSYTNEHFNKYSYRLMGFDEAWNHVDVRQRTVQYTNLNFGDYVFRVKAMNSNGVWSDVSSYNIKILPPFWLTYKAFLIYIMVLSFIFYLVRKQIKASIRLKQQWIMERVKRERDEKLNSEKLRFFTNISHELRTPLTLILGPTKQLMEINGQPGNQHDQKKLGLIYQNANRLLNLVDQILDFRKAQEGQLELKVIRTDILLHTGNTFQSFQELAEDKMINFNLIHENDGIEGWIDRNKYDIILYNLLSNAFKFTHKYGNIDLFLGTQMNAGLPSLIIEVSDDGIGIPPESQSKIFSRFYQTLESKKNNTGSGIGLSLVKALVELHKGKIEVRSEPKKGSVFTVKIPLAREAYQNDEIFEYGQKQQMIKEFPQIIPQKKIIQNTELKERILIIEDNIELRNYLVDYLSDFYTVFGTDNGKKGLQLCKQIKPILCVSDVMMPIMGGLEFCEALKNDESTSHIPIILLTALSENEDKIKGYSSGADGYLAKPFDPSLLKTRINNIIKSRKELKMKFSGEAESGASMLTHSPIDEEFMDNLTKLIQNELDNVNLDTGFLCCKLGMSSSKLYRKIKELTDLAPNEFIRTIRLKKGAQLLKTKKYNVSEVTNLTGFNDPLYFSRCFKKQFGYPPSNLIK